MTTPLDVGEIMAEIQRLAAARRQASAAGGTAGVAPQSPLPIDRCTLHADLAAPVAIPYGGMRRWALHWLDRLRARALEAILRRQTFVNRATIASLEKLAAQIAALESRLAALEAARAAGRPIPERRSEDG